MGKKLFDFVIGNPPYQQEAKDSKPKSNGQKPMTNIFQYFQAIAPFCLLFLNKMI